MVSERVCKSWLLIPSWLDPLKLTRLLMSKKAVLFSVGTTSFDAMMDFFDQKESIEVLQQIEVGQVFLQLGSSSWRPKNLTDSFEVSIIHSYDQYMKCLGRADLVICHSGAGTLLDCLKANKRIFSVVNDSLVDNHQLEIFQELQRRNLIIGEENSSSLSVPSLKSKLLYLFGNKVSFLSSKKKTSVVE